RLCGLCDAYIILAGWPVVWFMRRLQRSADECVQKLESELDELQTELDSLAQQNAKLLIENAEMRGKLEAQR
ncbi:hypothetical protein ACP7H9_14060, partial [Idiomarina sp. ST20R2A10]